jgi:hypothetical protein
MLLILLVKFFMLTIQILLLHFNSTADDMMQNRRSSSAGYAGFIPMRVTDRFDELVRHRRLATLQRLGNGLMDTTAGHKGLVYFVPCEDNDDYLLGRPRTMAKYRSVIERLESMPVVNMKERKRRAASATKRLRTVDYVSPPKAARKSSSSKKDKIPTKLDDSYDDSDPFASLLSSLPISQQASHVLDQLESKSRPLFPESASRLSTSRIDRERTSPIRPKTSSPTKRANISSGDIASILSKRYFGYAE